MISSINGNKFDPKQIRHETIKRIFLTGLISLLIFCISLVLIFSLFPFTTSFPAIKELTETAEVVSWVSLEGVASALSLSLIIAGLAFAFIEHFPRAIQQRREGAVACFEIYKEVYDRLTDPEALVTRRWIITNIKTPEEMGSDKQSWLEHCRHQLNDRPENWNHERSPGKIYLKRILNLFDFIGFVARYYWNMDDDLVEWMSPSVAKVWERISLYVEDEAERRNEPDFYDTAREFGNHCVQWRRAHYQDSVIIPDGT